MTERNNRIREAIDKKSSQQKVADKLNITRQAVNLRLASEKDIDSIDFITAVAELTDVPFHELIFGQKVLPHIPERDRSAYNFHLQEALRASEQPIEPYLSGKIIRPITVVVDRAGKELITYVPVKAQAGYRRGYADPSFIEKLPAFSLPVMLNINATNRMFQVDGNSMRQLGGGGLNDGDIVFGEYVEDIFSLKDGRVYIIVTTEEVLVKRVINRLLTDSKVLILNSDNKGGDYPAIIVHPTEILEVWEYKAHLSRQLPMNTDLFDTINDLQVKHSLLEDRLKSLEMQQLK